MTAWTWDVRKNEANQRKHRVSFELASKVFEDPLALSLLDENADEERWLTVGKVEGVAVFVVVHTWHEPDDDEPHGRIISARKATKREVKVYKEGRF
jgi:uncharacterized DUF497 family protein